LLVQEADRITQEAIDWLRKRYDDFRFFLPRDVAWTLQTRLLSLAAASPLDIRVFNDYLMLPGRPRAIYADLALLGPDDSVALALEVRYEPSHARPDILSSRLPLVFWGEGVVNDVQRVREFARREAAASARSLFVDEGGHFRSRTPPPGSAWHDWGQGRWALMSRFSQIGQAE
jgi:hypothetical protein